MSLKLEFKVRDYECDLQGIVNNAVYQNYLEHARHEYLHSKGVDFAELSRQGVDLVVVRAELDYKKPLTSGDAFHTETSFRLVDRVRFAFDQRIVRSDGVLCLQAVIIATAMNARGRPSIPPGLIDQLTAGE
ncbi:4-hydroxybenzoyl-CoA thioesterase [Saccharospirillum sp. MSK14-1]|uniref:acyl-CoA thioesterase n=1 Tax=Saccharospirillum sp. MSK14-1 TaxID=1897632 RepID=UPI000D379CD9|nr:acyl-CoA thioesterase [Saccharospirillum sp. MSK14-1]PTY37700.1 4-hydroxybenzoyl-CoA thioesterase [Saccharospirillum sp. MSK14-1]